jgi:hypothetical protein
VCDAEFTFICFLAGTFNLPTSPLNSRCLQSLFAKRNYARLIGACCPVILPLKRLPCYFQRRLV